ncbi:MAG TPA: T9SS type A sorting domain-containing protein [Bacteroidia bacterium]|nr:T9SS type A sorting domain-containing protein [Bacteroidia bacterium]
MKKILQLIAAVTLTFSAVESKAQLADGSIAPDWTFTDIVGNTHNLYTYLNAGKTVYIDVSATWCGPCWSYHGTGNLENLYTTYGPSGTDEVMVFFIEGDGATDMADLDGTDGASQGDWITGTPYPIINPSASATTTFNTNYAIGYFPTIYMICPDRSITEVGQASTATLYAAKSACSIATAPVDAQMMLSTALNTSLMSCDSVTPTFRIGNVGTTTLTSATITLKVDGVTQKVFPWTGSLATYGNTTFTGVKVGSTVPGTHTITCEVSNPNGTTDPTSANNSTTASFNIFPTTGGAPVVQSFEASGIPTAWNISNGGDAATWDDATVGYTSSKSMTLNWYNIPAGDIDIITLDPMSFAGATGQSMTFNVAYRQYTTENDNLRVEVSTNCGTTWTSAYNKSGATLSTLAASTTNFVPSASTDWRLETVNLSSYAGTSNVLVRFKGTSGYGNNIYVDNINITQVMGVEESNLVTGVNVYPNPMANNASVDFNLTSDNNVSIVLVNTVGQLVKSENLGNMSSGLHTYQMDASSLSNGLYFLNITVGNSTITKKVAINK